MQDALHGGMLKVCIVFDLCIEYKLNAQAHAHVVIRLCCLIIAKLSSTNTFLFVYTCIICICLFRRVVLASSKVYDTHTQQYRATPCTKVVHILSH